MAGLWRRGTVTQARSVRGGSSFLPSAAPVGLCLLPLWFLVCAAAVLAAGSGRGAPWALLSLKQPFRRPPPAARPAHSGWPRSLRQVTWPRLLLCSLFLLFSAPATLPVSRTFRARGQVFWGCSRWALRVQVVTRDGRVCCVWGRVASVQSVLQDLASGS